LAEQAETHVALASLDERVVRSFTEAEGLPGVTRHLLKRSGETVSDDWRRSRALSVWLGRSPYRGSLEALQSHIQPNVTWFFETESLRRTGAGKAPAVLDHCDVRWLAHMRMARRERGGARVAGVWRAALIRAADLRAAALVDVNAVASPLEVDSLRPLPSATVLPNGFEFPDECPRRAADGTRLVFFGSLFYEPNADGVRWFCREVWPLVREILPGAEMDVAGEGHESVRDVWDTPGVRFHGFVDSLSALIERASALVVPVRFGGGTRIKIIEAWSLGLPVVTTAVGAEGLSVRHQESALVGDSAEDFARSCVRLLERPDEGDALALAGFAHGKAHFSWEVIYSELGALLERAAEK
jgi:glycosyltransferase involved in cell wall biosynthesis